MKKLNQNEIIKFLTEANAVEKNSSQMELLQMLNEAPVGVDPPEKKLSWRDRAVELARKALPNTMNVLDKGKELGQIIRGVPVQDRTKIGGEKIKKTLSQPEFQTMIQALKNKGFAMPANPMFHYTGQSPTTDEPMYSISLKEPSTGKVVVKTLQTDGTIVQ